MYDRITLDRETFKALAMETRVRILKRLEGNYQQTLTDLAKDMDMAPSTIKEHLDKLLEVGLIQQVERGGKWKYYRLTDKGKRILNPHEKRVMIILAASTLFLLGVFYRLIYLMGGLVKGGIAQTEQPMPARAAEEVLVGSRDAGYAESALSAGIGAMEETTTTLREFVQNTAAEFQVLQVPYAELVLALALAMIAGICMGYLIRRRIT